MRVRSWLKDHPFGATRPQASFSLDRIVQSDTNGELHESGNVRRLPGCYQSADFRYLILIECDGDLLGRHTNYHTNLAHVVSVDGVSQEV
jgi:hypothetical protein